MRTGVVYEGAIKNKGNRKGEARKGVFQMLDSKCTEVEVVSEQEII